MKKKFEPEHEMVAGKLSQRQIRAGLMGANAAHAANVISK